MTTHDIGVISWVEPGYVNSPFPPLTPVGHDGLERADNLFLRVNYIIFLLSSQNCDTMSNPVVAGSHIMDILNLSSGEYHFKDGVAEVVSRLESMALHNLLKAL